MWSKSAGADGSGSGVFGRRFNQLGLFQGDEFQVNTTTAGDQYTYYFNSIGMQANGNFMVVWGGNGPGDGSGLFGQHFAVVNTVPTVEIGTNVTVNEALWSRAASFSDPDADTWTASVDYGDGSGLQPLALNADKSFALSHTYALDGVYSVTVTVTDNEGAVGSDSLEIAVKNAAPSVTQFSVTPATFSGVTTVTASGQFTDRRVGHAHGDDRLGGRDGDRTTALIRTGRSRSAMHTTGSASSV